MPTPAPLIGADLTAYDALRAAAVCFPRSGRHHLEFTGPKAADALTGLVTNDVLALEIGHGQFAAALTAKGRIVADLRILRVAQERYLTSTSDAAWPGWRDLVRKFVNPRLAKYAEVELGTIAVHGPLAHTVVTGALATLGTSSPLTAVHAPYACTAIMLDDQELFVVESPELGRLPGLELVVPPELASRLLEAITRAEGVVMGTDALWDVARVENGRPAWGRDMDETTIPQEANLGDLNALSFNKGCYTGQETVARIHFRGHVNRHLRVITSDVPLPVPSELHADDGKVIGDIRSSVISPSLGPLAIAMVRRELAPGDTVHVPMPDAAPVSARITSISGPLPPA